MAESEKCEQVSLSESKGEILYPLRCPVCNVDTNYVYRMHEAKKKQEADWYRCQCGVIFQKSYELNRDVYDGKYIADYAGAKQAKERHQHALWSYINVIEELTYGRMMLDVGFNTPFIINELDRRGWITWGIDINPTIEGRGNIYNGDFETYDFSIGLKDQSVIDFLKKDKLERQFDLIWMSHVLEHFVDPVAALKKAFNLLQETGVLFISTPDIDFINKTGTAGWPHWNKKEHNILWSERALVRELERIGFKIILKRRNYSSRFISWYDSHIIAQKEYF